MLENDLRPLWLRWKSKEGEVENEAGSRLFRETTFYTSQKPSSPPPAIVTGALSTAAGKDELKLLETAFLPFSPSSPVPPPSVATSSHLTVNDFLIRLKRRKERCPSSVSL